MQGFVAQSLDRLPKPAAHLRNLTLTVDSNFPTEAEAIRQARQEISRTQ